MDGSPPGSSVHGILQARILEWVAMPSSRGSSSPGVESASPAGRRIASRFFTAGCQGSHGGHISGQKTQETGVDQGKEGAQGSLKKENGTENAGNET